MTKFLFCVVLMVTLLPGSGAQDWMTSMDDAKLVAKKTTRPIILVFQGSDWCAPCMKLDREIWSSEAFRTYAESHYILVKADFPKRKKNALSKEQAEHNAHLAEMYNHQGIFPLIVILDDDGHVLGQTGYINTTPSAYISMLDSFIQ